MGGRSVWTPRKGELLGCVGALGLLDEGAVKAAADEHYSTHDGVTWPHQTEAPPEVVEIVHKDPISHLL